MFENIKTISDGKIKFRYYRSNSIVPNNELWSGVIEGNLDSAFTSSVFNANKIPALMFFTAIPFGPRLIEYKAWMQYGGGQAIKDKIYTRAESVVRDRHEATRALSPPQPRRAKLSTAGRRAPLVEGWIRV